MTQTTPYLGSVYLDKPHMLLRSTNTNINIHLVTLWEENINRAIASKFEVVWPRVE